MTTDSPGRSQVAIERRVPSIDTLRALAIVAMVAYHFCFDLRLHGLARIDFESDPFWLAARASIVSSFLLLAGVSLVLADRDGLTDGGHWRRIGVIALCALAVSVTSYIAFPRSFIYFGVLHCIAASLIIARPLVGKPALATLVGVAIIVAGLVVAHPAFDSPITSWIGFVTRKPVTEDYVPLFPWSGVVLIGIAIGRALLATRFKPIAFLSRAPETLRWIGRHSLAIYMIHQPVLIGALWLFVRARN
ncbi:MAG TPA: heparan-alpha-glucosaminide N-acetyltransferase [Casimicrobiaceae bacterium]|nr:heparan-alpha-glucosaminide N-acetyltransferase [Casimicrobiaceae bacterium]